MSRSPALSALVAIAAAGCAGAQAQNAPPEGIIVVSIDTLRADATSPYGGPPGRTPNLARLASESIVFENTFAQANETLPSHASLFTSQLPSHLGPLDYDLTIPDGTPTLASVLSAGGWTTAAVVAGGHLARIFGVDDGFGLYVEGQRWGSFQQTLPMGMRWVEKAAAGDQPWMLFLHSYDCHGPYVKPGFWGRQASPGYAGPLASAVHDPHTATRIYKDGYFPDFPLERVQTDKGELVLKAGERSSLPAWAGDGRSKVPLSADDVAFLRGLYGTGVTYADLWLGVLLDELDRLGVADTTTLVVLSDHGEDLLDHDFLGHRVSLHDATTQVPLMVRLPKARRKAARVSGLVRLLDVAPTLLALAGQPPPASFEGQSLAACLDDPGCQTPGVAVSEAVDKLVSATDGKYRIQIDGIEAHSARIDGILAEPESRTTTLWDVGGPPGTEQALPLDRLPPARLQRLTAAARAERAR